MKKFLQLIYQVYRYMLYLVALLLILLAVTVTLLQYLVRNIDDYQDEVVEYLQQQINIDFSVEAIHGAWKKRTPAITIEGLEIKTEDENKLRFGDFYLSLDIVKTFESRQLVLKSFSIKNAELNFKQQEAGAWSLVGMQDFKKISFRQSTSAKTGEPSAAAPEQLWTNLFDNLNRIDIQETTLNFHFYEGGSFEMRDIDIQLEGDSRKRHMTLTSIIDNQHVMRVFADINGRPNDENFSITAYGKLNETELTGFIPVDDRAYQLEKFSASGEFWADYADGFLQVVGSVGIPQLKLKNRDAVLLGNFRSDFVLENAWGDELNIWMDNVRWLWGGKTQAFKRIFMQHDYQQNNFHCSIPEINMQKFSDSLLASGLLSEKLQQQLATMQLTGELENLHVDIPLDSKIDQALLITAYASELSSKAYKGIPGFENVSGNIQSGLQAGWIDVAVNNRMGIDLPYVYRQYLEFEKVSGRVSWKIEPERVYVSSPSLLLQDGDQVGQVLLDLDLPKNKKSAVEPWMTLMVSLQNAKAGDANKFIPYTLPQDLLQWLGDSIVDGKVNSGAFIYEGSISKTPSSKPAVQLLLDVENAELKFSPEWPAVKNLAGRLLLDDTEVLADIVSGTMSDLAIEDAKVKAFVPEEMNGTVVDVQAYFNGNLANAFSLLKDSPIHEVIGEGMDTWQFIGSVNGDVDLRIPLHTDDQHALKTWVNANLKQSTMRIPELELVLNHVAGAIHYDQQAGLSSYGLEGSLWGETLTARIETEEPVTRINVEALVDSKEVGKWLEQPLFEFTTGKAEVEAEIIIASDESMIDVTSDLKGVTFNLPEPFKKQADVEKHLSVHVPLAESFVIDAQLQNMGNLKLAFEPDLTRAEFAIMSEAQLQNTKGFEVTGQLETLDLDLWLPVIERYVELLEDQSGGNNSNSSTEPFLFSMNELKVANALAFGADWGEADISVLENPEYFTVDFATRDVIGQVLLHEDKPFDVIIDFIRFEDDENVVPAGIEQPVLSRAEIPVWLEDDPLNDVVYDEIPDMDVEVRSAFVGKDDFGSWNFQLRNIEGNYQIKNIEASIKGMTISGNAIWNPAKKLSTFNGTAITEDFGYVLEKWDFPRSLEAEQASFNLDVSWPGSPAFFDSEFLAGDIGFYIRDGYFMEATSSASGALKALSLLNIAKIAKRLKLDFSDMKKGVSFERMRGAINIEEEIAEITEDVDIRSTAAEFKITGQVDLKDEQFANQLVLTLPVSKNLPWIAVLVGGWNPVGLGAAAVAKVLDKQVDKLSSGVYNITGSFDDPNIEFIKVFTDKSAKLEVNRKAEGTQPDVSLDVQKLQTQELNAQEQEAEAESVD